MTTALAGAAASAATTAAATTAAAPTEVRVDQVGYAASASKVAFAMLPGRVASVGFTVTSGGRTVFRGVSRDDAGSWNSRYGAVYELDFSALRRCGTYQVHVGSAVSPPFRIATGQALYGQLVDNAVRYFTSERDGADVDHSVLDREPANLTDEKAHVYATPQPGQSAYYVTYRPVFEAAPPGQKVSPDLAGRYAADFALGAQLPTVNAAQAERYLSLARSVYADAKTTDVGQIVTVYPSDFYPGTEWKSDMLWGAAEIALADEALHEPAARIRADLGTAAYWAKEYIAQGHPAGGDTMNLYDNGAIGEAELLRAMQQARRRGVAPAIAPEKLVNDLGAQLRVGEGWAKGDPFELGTQLGASDAAPHAFGLFVTDELYQEYGGSDQYHAFAQQQLNFALGGNAWGSSFVVGAGTVYPNCMQSEIANLAGSLTGHGNIQLGAATDGPSSPDNFVGLDTVTGMRACSAGSFSAFNSSGAAYEDNVVAWPSVEPADDYTADSLLAFALGAAGRG